MKAILDKKTFIHEDDVGLLKDEILKECIKNFDESSIDCDKKIGLKSLLNQNLDADFEEDKDRASSHGEEANRLAFNIERIIDYVGMGE